MYPQIYSSAAENLLSSYFSLWLYCQQIIKIYSPNSLYQPIVLYSILQQEPVFPANTPVEQNREACKLKLKTISITFYLQNIIPMCAS